jgi:hypothetical protein
MSEDLADLALDVGTAVGFERAASALGQRVRGPAGFLAQGGIAAAELAATGRLGKGSALGAAASAASMVGARLIPGVGWAMLAYTGADIASRTMLGKPFGETWVGRPIDWAVDKAERGAIGVATKAFDAVGWTGASDFMTKTLRPWALGEDAPGTFIRGPATTMTADDWYEHPPAHYSDRLPHDTDLTTVTPSAEDVEARRTRLIETEEQAITRDQVAADLDVAPGGTASAIRMAAALISGREAPPVEAPRTSGQKDDIER